MNHKKNKTKGLRCGLGPKTIPLRSGQVMVLTIMVMGGVMLSAITIAGMLTIFQIRQSGDISRSTQAIYAADAGSEFALYQMFKPTEAASHPWYGEEVVMLENGAEFHLLFTAVYRRAELVSGSPNPRCSCDRTSMSECGSSFVAEPEDTGETCYDRTFFGMASYKYNRYESGIRSFGKSGNANRAFEVLLGEGGSAESEE